MLSDRCPVLSVCDVGVLCPHGWTDQNETWHVDRAWPWPLCVRWGPSSTSPKEAQPPIFGQCLSDQMAGWIKMPLGMEVGLGPDNTVLDGDSSPPPTERGTAAPTFKIHGRSLCSPYKPRSVSIPQLDGSSCHLVWR